MNDADHNNNGHSAYTVNGDAQAYGGAQGGAEDDNRLLRVIHAALRGRYPWAIGLGLVLGVGLGVAGWMSTTPLYKSNGSIRIKAYTPKILFENENSGQMPRYDNYLKAQANTMRSNRVINAALQTDVWKPYSEGMSPQARERFVGQLGVGPNPEIEQISVSFTDEDPERAEAATAAVLESYHELQSNIDREQDLSRLAVLEDLRNSYNSQLSQLRYQIEQVDRTGEGSVSAWHSAKVRQYSDYEDRIELLNSELASLEAMKKQREQEPGSAPQDELPEELAQSEEGQLVERIRSQIARLQDETTLLIRRLGENHRSVEQNRDRIHLLETEMTRLQQAGLNDPSGDPAESDPLAERIAKTQAQLEMTQKQAEKTRQEMEDLADKLRQIAELRSQQQELTTSLAQTKSRINQLNVESELNNRVDILSFGEASWQPVNGSQRVARAGIGGTCGFVFGFALVGLLGLRSKTVNRSDILQLDIGDKPLLGLMPELSEKLKEGPMSQSAQASVDHIRSLLHMDMNTSRGNCIAITGPQSGSGKTTLAITLALSFAESGSRTLIIDLDVVGGGLSNHVRARRRKRLGEILAEVANVDRSEIETVASQMNGTGMQLGQLLVEQGIVQQHHVETALERQQQEMGVRHALAGAEFEHCTFPSQTSGLDVLPLRVSEDNGRIGRVGPKAIKQLFERAREAYDVVIIDTGPAPGCVETSLACAAADMNVVVVSRNDVRGEVRSCIEFLESIRANIFGYVMNRVDTHDMKTSKHSSSFRHASLAADIRNPLFAEESLNARHTGRQEHEPSQPAL